MWTGSVFPQNEQFLYYSKNYLQRHVDWDSQQVNAQHPFNINHFVYT